jgi:hypothetical protein
VEGLGLEAVILNSLYPRRFENGQAAKLGGALERSSSALARAALTAALSEHARAAVQHDQRDRLREGLGVELVELPFIFADNLGRAELERLADALEAGLQQTGPTTRHHSLI